MRTLSLILAALALLFTALDWMQTVHIAHNPLRFYEKNPVLGPHPSVQMVNVYFALCLLFVIVVGLALLYMEMDGALLGAAAILLAVEVYWVVSNYRMGIRFDLPW